jgi:hypothetical protein
VVADWVGDLVVWALKWNVMWFYDSNVVGDMAADCAC